MEWLAGIGGLALLARLVWIKHKARSWDITEIRRLRRTAEIIHREEAQPFG